MSSDITTDVVRAALGMREKQASLASINIANSGKADARAMRLDFAQFQAALADVERVESDRAATMRLREAELTLRDLWPEIKEEPVSVDEEIGDLVVASTSYQALTEALSRHFGLMRLAISGRS